MITQQDVPGLVADLGALTAAAEKALRQVEFDRQNGIPLKAPEAILASVDSGRKVARALFRELGGFRTKSVAGTLNAIEQALVAEEMAAGDVDDLLLDVGMALATEGDEAEPKHAVAAFKAEVARRERLARTKGRLAMKQVHAKGLEQLQGLVHAPNPWGFGGLLLRGYASVYTEDAEADRMTPQALDKAARTISQERLPLLLEHNSDQVLGYVAKAWTDNYGLGVECIVPRPDDATSEPWRIRACIQLRERAIKHFSIGGPMAKRFDPYGHSFKEVMGLQLSEISVTARPVNTGAEFTVSTR